MQKQSKSIKDAIHKQCHADPYTDNKRKLIKESSNPFKFATKVSIPNDFCLTENMKAYAEKKGFNINLDNFTERFITKCRAKGYKYQDWYAAWQDWLQREFKENQASHNPTKTLQERIKEQPPLEDILN